MGPSQTQVTQIIQMISKKFKIQEEGDICEFLGIEIKKGGDGSLSLRQQQLIKSILKDLQLDSGNVAPRKTPALKTRILHKDATGEPFDESFHYRSVIGKLNYLEKST
jgi:acid stress-induced BolA-like protein IbaG/YrbA